MSANTALKTPETGKLDDEASTTSVLDILSKEIATIAREIEDLPETSYGGITSEQMVRMQQIDFCSQRLSEVSKLMKYLSKLEEASSENLPESLRNQANLEHVRNLFHEN